MKKMLRNYLLSFLFLVGLSAPVFAIRYVDVSSVTNVPLITVKNIEDFETLIDTYKPSVVLRTTSDFVIMADGTYFVLPRKGFATLQKYWESTEMIASMSQKEIVEAAAGTGVYWTVHSHIFHLYEDCPNLNRSETLITGSAQEAVDVGKKYLCSACEKRYRGTSEVAIPISEEYTIQKDVYEWYTSLDQIRTQTKDAVPASVVVQVALGYKKNDKIARKELKFRRMEIIDFLKRFLSSKTQEELRTENEELLKQQILNHINDDILTNSKIKAVMFTAKDVVAQ